jgi:hypothetical protein
MYANPAGNVYGNVGPYGPQAGYFNGMNGKFDDDDGWGLCGSDDNQFYDYGGIEVLPVKPIEKIPTFALGNRRKLNIVAILLCFLIPSALFAGVYALLSFNLHYGQPSIVYALLGVAAFFVIVAGCMSLGSRVRKAIGDPTRQPNWYMFFFVTMLIAYVLGVALGEWNFKTYLQPYYDMQNLGNYTNIDPSRIRGQQVMDAGTITFTQGTRLDLAKSMGFKSEQTYCVAPIVMPSEQPAQYDFWAVGTDCCSGSSADFHCKDFNDPGAIGALRATSDGDRAMYRLAVQQAEATYKIKATHPLFFIWTHNPIEEMDSFRHSGMKAYLGGIFGYMILQAFLVVAASVAFSKMGYF